MQIERLISKHRLAAQQAQIADCTGEKCGAALLVRPAIAALMRRQLHATTITTQRAAVITDSCARV